MEKETKASKKKHKAEPDKLDFSGFGTPRANFVRMPIAWLNACSQIRSVAVIKLVQYIIRHTWGYLGEEDRPKRISVDEFAHGRKKKDGKRIDGGTGLSPQAIRDGLALAVRWDLLEVDENKRDLGRIKRFYRLKMEQKPSDKPPQIRDLISRGQHPEIRDQSLEIRPRTWKDTCRKDTSWEKNLQEHNTMFELKSSNRTNSFDEPSSDEETQQPSSTESSDSSSQESSHHRGRKKKQPSSFDERAAREFADAVRCRRKVQKNSDLRQWANVFRQMREVDEIPKKEIREMIQWYAEHINDEFVPEAFSASTFRQKFADGRFERAVKRSSNGRCSSDGKRLTRENMWDDPSNVLPGGILRVEIGSDGKQYDGRLLHRIRRRVRERFGNGLPLPEKLKAVLTEEFPEAGEIPLPIIGSVG